MTGWWELRNLALAVLVLDILAAGVSLAGAAALSEIAAMSVAIGLIGFGALYAIIATIASGSMSQMALPSGGPGHPATHEWRMLDAYARGARRIGEGHYVKNHFANMWSPGLVFGIAAAPLVAAGVVLASRFA